MSGIVGLFASIGDHIPILKKEKFGQPDPEGIIASFHYRGTALLIFGFTLMVTCTEWVSGTGSIIDCLSSGAVDGNVINTYCWIMGTFSVRRHYVNSETEIGYHVAETGVGPYHPKHDKIDVKAYYQWVPFMLFLQGCMFYIPHVVHKYFESGKVKAIVAGLQMWVLDNNERSDKESALANYVIETKGTHNTWCLKLIFARFLYLLNVVGQIIFTDCFLGWEFSNYGVQAVSLLELDPEQRSDPMSKVFPRLTKCTFQKYGHSGTIMTLDATCVLPINIINEKIFVFLWFWFSFLALITFINFLFDIFLIFSQRAKLMIIRRKLQASPRKNNLKIDVNMIVNTLDFGDWKLFYQLLKNIDSLVFKEFCENLTEKLQKKSMENSDADSILKLKNLEDSNENINRTSPKGGDFLTLDEIGSGNYVKAPSPTGSTHKESSI